jgi:protein MpaA
MPESGVRRLAGVVLTVVAIGLAGCASHRPLPPKLPPPPVPAPLQPTVILPPKAAGPGALVTVELGRSVLGRPIEATVFEGTRGCILILGAIHGDEPLAGELVERMASYLKAHPEARAGRTIVLIPHANPDGLAAGTRWNARGVDVNRNFPTRNFTPDYRHGSEPLSEPESGALVAAIARYQPSCVISVHSPLSCIDPDGGKASSALAREMALYSPLPIKLLPALPGSLGSYAGNELNLKMITYELDRKDLPGWNSAGYLDRHLKPLLVAVEKCGAGTASSQRTVDKPVRRGPTGNGTGY